VLQDTFNWILKWCNPKLGFWHCEAKVWQFNAIKTALPKPFRLKWGSTEKHAQWTINASYNQRIIQSTHHTINASYNQRIIQSTHHTINASYNQRILQSTHHTINASYNQRHLNTELGGRSIVKIEGKKVENYRYIIMQKIIIFQKIICAKKCVSACWSTGTSKEFRWADWGLNRGWNFFLSKYR
jgi:hypothetical protein